MTMDSQSPPSNMGHYPYKISQLDPRLSHVGGARITFSSEEHEAVVATKKPPVKKLPTKKAPAKKTPAKKLLKARKDQKTMIENAVAKALAHRFRALGLLPDNSTAQNTEKQLLKVLNEVSMLALKAKNGVFS